MAAGKEDIAPELLKKVQEDYRKRCENDKELARIEALAESGKASGKDTDAYAVRAGELLAAALHDNVSGDVLPDGKMYFNIANRVLPPVLRDNYELVAGMSTRIQQVLNDNAGLHMKALRPDLNEDRVKGLVNLAASADQYEDKRKELEADVVNFSQRISADGFHKNAEFQYTSGFNPKIRREAESGCCKWCQALEGTYDYADVRDTGNDVWRRHRDCRCVVEYDPGDGRRQNAHTKTWSQADDHRKKIEDAEKAMEQEYKPVNRGNEIYTDSKYQDVRLRKAEGYENDIYLSENVSIKPRALHNLDTDLSEAIKCYGGDASHRPKLAVISQNEIGNNRVALYDSVGNTLYVIPEVGDRKKVLGFQKDMACCENPKATMYHETWHWMQAEEYRRKFGNITVENKKDYIKYASLMGKKRLDNAGYNKYNIIELSEYADMKYNVDEKNNNNKKPRYDEADAEMSVKKALKKG